MKVKWSFFSFCIPEKLQKRRREKKKKKEKVKRKLFGNLKTGIQWSRVKENDGSKIEFEKKLQKYKKYSNKN